MRHVPSVAPVQPTQVSPETHSRSMAHGFPAACRPVTTPVHALDAYSAGPALVGVDVPPAHAGGDGLLERRDARRGRRGVERDATLRDGARQARLAIPGQRDVDGVDELVLIGGRRRPRCSTPRTRRGPPRRSGRRKPRRRRRPPRRPPPERPRSAHPRRRPRRGGRRSPRPRVVASKEASSPGSGAVLVVLHAASAGRPGRSAQSHREDESPHPSILQHEPTARVRWPRRPSPAPSRAPTSCRWLRRGATGRARCSCGRPCRTPRAGRRPTSCGCASRRR